jgi:L-ribulose-5-phosphate 4-epimerase
VILEYVADMATRTLLIDAEVQPIVRQLQAKHFTRRHGPNAYYGQVTAKRLVGA